MQIICDICNHELKKPGLTLLSPLRERYIGLTFHICLDCWYTKPLFKQLRTLLKQTATKHYGKH